MVECGGSQMFSVTEASNSLPLPKTKVLPEQTELLLRWIHVPFQDAVTVTSVHTRWLLSDTSDTFSKKHTGCHAVM